MTLITEFSNHLIKNNINVNLIHLIRIPSVYLYFSQQVEWDSKLQSFNLTVNGLSTVLCIESERHIV